MTLYIIVGIILIIFILYLLTIMPRMIYRPDITPFAGRYYAHRGLHDNKTNAPENSLMAFELAIQQGYGIELDVQLTRDNIPVVFHDYNLKRVCGIDGIVKDFTFKELHKYKLYHSNERIPKLEDVLALINGRVPIIIELKIPWSATLTCERADKVLRNYQGVFCIESFNPFGLIWYKKHHPKIMRGQLSTDFFKDKEDGKRIKFIILQNLLLNFLAKPDFIAFHYIHNRRLSFVICTKFYKAHAFAWTIKSEEALKESRKYFKFFIFDSFIPKE